MNTNCKEQAALPATQALASAEDESAHGPHTVTQRDPGLAAKRRQHEFCHYQAWACVKKIVFPLFPSSIPTRKNSPGPQTRNLNTTCVTKADAASELRKWLQRSKGQFAVYWPQRLWPNPKLVTKTQRKRPKCPKVNRASVLSIRFQFQGISPTP